MKHPELHREVTLGTIQLTDILHREVTLGTVLQLVGIRHLEVAASQWIARTADKIPRKWTPAERARAAELVPEVAAAVLDAIGVKSWPVDINQNPFMAAESLGLPPWLQGRPWSDLRESAQTDADPELQRVARSSPMVYGYTGGALDLWVSGLADVDLTAVAEDGAELEVNALRAVDAWVRPRMEQRKEDAAAKYQERFEHWTTAAREAVAKPLDERLENWQRVDGTSTWLWRVCQTALFVAEVETKRAPAAVVPPVSLELWATPARSSDLFLDGRAGLGDLVAWIPESALEILSKGAERSLSLTEAGNKLLAAIQTPRARRFARDMIVTSQRQSLEGKGETVSYEGGATGLAERFGGKREDWRDTLDAGYYLHVHQRTAFSETKAQGLWLYAEREIRTSQGRRLIIDVKPGPLLDRGAVNRIDFSTGTGLVPLLRYDTPIPAGFPRKYEAAAYRLQDRLLLLFVDEWRTVGGPGLDTYRIPRAHIERMAEEAGLDDFALLWGVLWPAWLAGTPGSNPALIEVDPGRTALEVRLADPHAAEREFIANGVRKRRAGQAGGLKRRRSR